MYRGNATEASAWVDYIPDTLCYDYIFMVRLFWINIIARRGLACVAYLYVEAMRRPEFRDKHGEIDSYAFFISHLN